MRVIDAGNTGVLCLGYAGENDRTVVRFPFGDIKAEYPGGVVILRIRRPWDTDHHDVMPEIDQDGVTAIWTVSDYDLETMGEGECQLIYSNGTVIAKRKVWKTKVDRSIDGVNASIPPNWEDIEEALVRAAGEVIAAIEQAVKPTDEQVAQAVSEWLEDHPEATTTVEDGSITLAKLNQSIIDDEPEEDSGNLITSGAVYDALEDIQDKLVFDDVPTAGSENPVKSNGIKTALDAKQDALTFDDTPTASSDNPVKSGGVKTAIDTVGTALNYRAPDPTSAGAGKFLQTDINGDPEWGEAASVADVVAAAKDWLDDHITAGAGTVDDTLLIPGAAADSKTVGDALSTQGEEIDNLESVTYPTANKLDMAAEVLDSIGSFIPFTSASAGEMWDNLVAILKGTFSYCTINWSGSNYTSDNNSPYVSTGSAFACTISPSEGFIISSVTASMGGSSITPTENQDGTYSISIASVTDDITITVSTSLDPSIVIYHVENLVCDGTQEPIETSLEFSSASANGVTDDWTICAKAIMTERNDFKYVFVSGDVGTRCSFDSYAPGPHVRIRLLGGYEVNSTTKSMINQEVGVVVTHVANSKSKLTCYYINTSDELVKDAVEFGGVNALDVDNGGSPLCVGARSDGQNAFIGTINDLTIHHRVLSDQEIEAYLTGGNE